MKFFLQLILAFVLSANHKSAAEIVRRVEKPALQTLATTKTMSGLNGVFNGPADTKFELEGSTFEIKNGENYVFTAVYKTDLPPSGTRILVIESNSTKETLTVVFDPNSKSRTQTTFPLNNCQIGIEKRENWTQTIYKARVKNCAAEDGFTKSFHFTLNFKSSGSFPIFSTDLNAPNQQLISKYFKYARTYYTSDDKDTFYTILNNTAMEADEVTITDFHFNVVRWELSLGDDFVASYAWKYDI